MKKPKAVVVDPAPPETTARAYEAAMVLVRAGRPLANRHLRALVKLKHTAYYYHLNKGEYDFLKLKVPVGGCKFSGVLVDKWIKGELVYEGFFGRKRQAKRWETALKKVGGGNGPTGA